MKHPGQLIIAFAAQPTWPSGPLPALTRTLAQWRIGPTDDGPADSFSPPHERALAHASGWPVVDGLLPFAAPDAAPGWGWLTPVHWHAGAEQVTLLPPADLDLDADEARALRAAIEPLMAEDGWRLADGPAPHWRVQHPSLAELPTASLDRAAGRNVDLWLGHAQAARPFRRLQAELQMLLHSHPLNAARDAQGRPAINSVWLHGTGTRPATTTVASAELDRSLAAAAQSGDAAGWQAAWQRLDAQRLAPWAEAAAPGACLTLCGERGARSWIKPPPPGALARLRQRLTPTRVDLDALWTTL